MFQLKWANFDPLKVSRLLLLKLEHVLALQSHTVKACRKKKKKRKKERKKKMGLYSITHRKTDAEAEAPILWLSDAKRWLIEKDLDAGKD